MKGGKQNGSPALQECEAGLFELRVENEELTGCIARPKTGRGRVQIVYLVKIDCQVILTRCEVALPRNQ